MAYMVPGYQAGEGKGQWEGHRKRERAMQRLVSDVYASPDCFAGPQGLLLAGAVPVGRVDPFWRKRTSGY